MNFRFSSYQFKNSELLQLALTHKSFAYENSKAVPAEEEILRTRHNEKLEFLGDAVLDLVLSEHLLEAFPIAEEGELSKMRAHLVNETSLAQRAENLHLNTHLLLGKGESQSGGARKPRLLAGGFEAVVGALFLEAGYDTTKSLVRTVFDVSIQELKEKPEFDLDYKSQLQEMVQAKLKQAPVYDLKEQKGPAHERIFEVDVRIGSEVLAQGSGKTKKAAEQRAAQSGIVHFQQGLKGSGQ